MPKEESLSDPCGETPHFSYLKSVVMILAAFLIGAISQGIVVWRDISLLSADLENFQQVVDANSAAIDVLARQTSANTIYREERVKNVEEWYRRVRGLEQDVRSLQRQSTGPDSFIRTEVRELEERIKKLESEQ